MTGPESFPVEDARKKFADILDGTQFRSTHTQITRRGKRAGYVVPPEWYDRAVEALSREEPVTPAPARQTTPATAPKAPVATRPAPQQTEPPEHPDVSPEVAALSYEQARDLFKDAETRHVQWAFRMRRELSRVEPGRRFHVGVQAAVDEGFITLGDASERPVGGEETTT